jgi:hypothetical protein
MESFETCRSYFRVSLSDFRFLGLITFSFFRSIFISHNHGYSLYASRRSVCHESGSNRKAKSAMQWIGCQPLRNTMKRYFYSSELLTVVEAKRLTTKFVIAGILMGIAILFSIIKVDQSMDNVLWSRSSNALAAENNYLRQQLNMISVRANKLDIQTKQLQEQDNKLYLVISHRKTAEDTVSSSISLSK